MEKQKRRIKAHPPPHHPRKQLRNYEVSMTECRPKKNILLQNDAKLHKQILLYTLVLYTVECVSSKNCLYIQVGTSTYMPTNKSFSLLLITYIGKAINQINQFLQMDGVHITFWDTIKYRQKVGLRLGGGRHHYYILHDGVCSLWSGQNLNFQFSLIFFSK